MPSATMSSDTGTVPTRVTSSRFIGRHAELAELEAALADAAARRPSIVFVAGESGVGKTRLLVEFHRAGDGDPPARVICGDCVELGEGELPYAPLVAARPLTGAGPGAARSPQAVRGELGALVPGLAPAKAEPAERAEPTPLGQAVRGAPGAARRARSGSALVLCHRGHPLGRSLHTRLPHVPRPQPHLRARAGGRHLPARRAASPSPAAAAPRGAGAHPAARRIELRAAHPGRAGGAARRHPGRRAGCRARRAPGCAARATRSSPRSCWPPGSTGAARCPRPSATR